MSVDVGCRSVGALFLVDSGTDKRFAVIIYYNALHRYLFCSGYDSRFGVIVAVGSTHSMCRSSGARHSCKEAGCGKIILKIHVYYIGYYFMPQRYTCCFSVGLRGCLR